MTLHCLKLLLGVATFCGAAGLAVPGWTQLESAVAQEPVPIDWPGLCEQTPWVFLGDSNTYSGGYVAILDAWLEAVPEGHPRPKLLNLGVSSETASGLSEVDHPFKRPWVHERIDKVLRMTQPAIVFVCYGMNDGIYQPDSQDNFDAFCHGIRSLSEKVRDSGAQLVVLTPPVFEPEPVEKKGKFGPTPQGRYAYFAPYRDYDLVLQHQTQWLLSAKLDALKVIDVRAILLHEKQVLQETDEQVSFSKDGVHFGNRAHGLIAEAVLSSLGAPAELLGAYPSNASISAATKRMKLLRDAYLSATGKNRPGLPAGLPVLQAEQAATKISH